MHFRQTLNPTVVYPTDRSEAGVPVLLLLSVALWLILQSDFHCLALGFVLVFFSLCSIAITSLGKERGGLLKLFKL